MRSATRRISFDGEALSLVVLVAMLGEGASSPLTPAPSAEAEDGSIYTGIATDVARRIAHEIKNPLEALTNLVYLARQDTAGREEYLQRAEHEIGRLDSIAQQALGFVRPP